MLALAPKSLAWVVLAHAVDSALAQRNTCTAGPVSDGANCIRRQRATFASPYCSSVLSLTTPTSTETRTTLDTVYQNSTTTRTFTAIGTPPITTTLSGVTVINQTTTFTETSTTFTDTTTTFVDTITSTSTSIVNSYTCDGGPSSTPGNPSSIPSTSASITASSSIASSASLSLSFSSFSVPSSSSFLPGSSFLLGPSSSSSLGSSSLLASSSSILPSSSSMMMSSSSSRFFSSSSVSKSIIPSGTGISRPGSSSSVSSSLPPFLNSSSASITPSASLSGSLSVSASGTASISIPHYNPPLAKRQTVSTVTVYSPPRCLRRFSKTYSGEDGITSACQCLNIATPSPVTTTVTTNDPVTTATSTSTIEVSSTITETRITTATELSTSTNLFSETTTITEMAVSTESRTYTITSVQTSVVTQSYPTPTSFNVYYTNSSSNDATAPANFFKAIEAPGGSGIVLAPEAAADSFTLDSQDRLVDTTGGDAFIAKNSDDLYPFELLQTHAATSNTPVCSACQGVLQCDYPGTKGNTFALCYGYLALGPPDVFGKDSEGDGNIDCVPITLRFK